MEFSTIWSRKKSYAISICLFLLSIISFFAFNINFWIDMTGGIQINYTYEKDWSVEDVLNKAHEIEKFIEKDWWEIINEISAYKITWENKVVLIAWFESSKTEEELETFKDAFRGDLNKSLAPNYSEEKYNFIGKSFWDYIKDSAKLTLIISVIAISLYVTFAFNGYVAGISAFSFWFITILTLAHDVVISAWLYLLVSNFFNEFKVDTYFITALLTILWYSINDTIVVLDRIRDNLRNINTKNGLNLWNVIDKSVNETMTRSIYTSLTVLLVLISIFFFGPETIKWFVLVMIFWTFVWTFSSIFIASPLLYEINKNKVLKTIEELEEEKKDVLI